MSMCGELSEIQKLNWGELAVIDELVSCIIGGPFFYLYFLKILFLIDFRMGPKTNINTL